MLAKGRLLGIQFLELFTDGLYEQGATHAIELAEQVRNTLQELQVPFLVPNRTNQIFPVLSDTVLEILRKGFSFSYQERVYETHSAVRFCTSWATTQEAVDALCAELKRVLGAE